MRKITMKRKTKSLEASSAELSDNQSKTNTDDENDNNHANENGNHHTPKNNKKKNKRNKKLETNGTDTEEEEQYEVETILDEKNVKGVRHFLIRWKGYGAESDTWEPEETVNCPELVTQFLNSKKTQNSGKKTKKRSSEVENKSPKKSKSNIRENEEFEVDRIIEVHHKKNGQREFLVHWKGYSAAENTWEPEENMNCPEIIEKFMSKVNKAREVDTRELRVNRRPTKPFTLSMEQSGRRLSRRHLGKQRTQYKDYE